MRRFVALTSLVLATSATTACGDVGSTLRPVWVRWRSFRGDLAVAVSESGTHIVLTDTSNANGSWGRFDIPPPANGTLMILDQHGAVLGERTGLGGGTTDLAIDDLGNAYLLRSRVTDAALPDAPVIPQRIVAVAADASERWSLDWDVEGGARMAQRILAVSEHVVVQSGALLVAYTEAGALAWTTALPSAALGGSVHDGALWFVGPFDETSDVAAVRCDAQGRCDEAIGLGEFPGFEGFGLGHEEILVRSCSGPWPDRACQITHHSMDGKITSRHDIDPSHGTVVVDDAVWSIESPTAYDHDVYGSVERRRHHIVLRHHDRWGAVDLAWARTFVEADVDAIDRAACPASDSPVEPRIGSRGGALRSLADGRLLLAATQGCRDTFLLALEVVR